MSLFRKLRLPIIWESVYPFVMSMSPHVLLYALPQFFLDAIDPRPVIFGFLFISQSTIILFYILFLTINNIYVLSTSPFVREVKRMHLNRMLCRYNAVTTTVYLLVMVIQSSMWFVVRQNDNLELLAWIITGWLCVVLHIFRSCGIMRLVLTTSSYREG